MLTITDGKKIALTIMSAVLVALVLTGSGRVQAVELDNSGPAEQPQTSGPFITDTAVPIEKGHFTIQPFLMVSLTGGEFSSDWRRVSAGGDFISLQMPVRLIYGPVDDVEVYVIVPFIRNWASHVEPPGPGGISSAEFGGIGDMNLTFKYRLLEETEKLPAITGLFVVNFPTGHHRHLNLSKLGTDLLGSGAYTYTMGINMSKWQPPVILYANLWYGIPSVATIDDEKIRQRDLLTFTMAAEWALTKNWVVLGEFYSYWNTGSLLGPASHQPQKVLLGVVSGIEYIHSSLWNCALGISVDIAGRNTSYNYIPTFTVNFNF